MTRYSSDSPLVTVVTPFHNTADYLAECIESVLTQEYPNFDYVLLNNSSTDGSDEIATEFANRDPRIRLYHNEELLDQDSNYSRAVEFLSPDAVYCKFAQADDKLLPGCISSMVDLAERYPKVGLVVSYYLRGTEVMGSGLPLEQDVLSGEQAALHQLVDGRYFLGSPTNQLFRAEIVRSRRPFFSADRLHADTEACYEILEDWDLGFVHQVLSFNRVHYASISGRVANWYPDVLDRYLLVHKYAPRFLEHDLAAKTKKDAKHRYYRRLAMECVKFPPRGFWDYHITALKRDGLWTGGSRLRLSGQIVMRLLDLILNPKALMDRIFRTVMNRKERVAHG